MTAEDVFRDALLGFVESAEAWTEVLAADDVDVSWTDGGDLVFTIRAGVTVPPAS